jgi:myo-inositol-1(or 4)-monophosphatase
VPTLEARALLSVARDVAREAAALVRARSSGVEVADTKTSATDVVTAVDHASEQLVRTRLAELRPGDAVLGEEGGQSEASTGGVRWIVDPIDGTVNFLYGLPQYAVSLAAEVDGRVVAGVVRNPATGREYAAALGRGATRDGTPIRVRPSAPAAHRLVLTGFSYDVELRAAQAAAVARLLPRVRDVRRLGSAALDLCHVAEGAADGYVEEGVHLWDHAAGALVAREAGARTLLTTGIAGRELMVCAPADGFEELLALVREVGLLG